MHELEALETHTTNLIRHCQELKNQNAQLKKKYDALAHDHAQLQQKQGSAAERIQRLITQLKTQTESPSEAEVYL